MAATSPTRFVILAVPRTGSNLLCTLLNSHPEILCHHEVFNPDGIFTAWTVRDQDLGLGTLEERDRDPATFLARIWRTGAPGGAIGFKWTRGQDPWVLDAVAGDPGVKKIVLQRLNHIKTYISDKIAQRTNQWEVYDHADLQQPRPRVTATRAELHAHHRANEQFYDGLLGSLRDRGQPVMQTTYESLFDACEQRRLLEYLGVAAPEIPLEPASVKQNSRDLRDLIANFSEFQESLAGSELGQLLDRGM